MSTHGQILNKINHRQLRAIFLYEQKFGTSSKDAAGLVNTAFGLRSTTERNGLLFGNTHRRSFSLFWGSQGTIYRILRKWTTIADVYKKQLQKLAHALEEKDRNVSKSPSFKATRDVHGELTICTVQIWHRTVRLSQAAFMLEMIDNCDRWNNDISLFLAPSFVFLFWSKGILLTGV